MSSAFFICIALLLVSINEIYADDIDDQKLVDAINKFGIGYYKKQRNTDQNTVVSGYGVATTMTMILAGARKDTEIHMRNALGYNWAGLSTKQVQDSYKRILTKQLNHDPAYELDVGNSLFLQSGFNVLPDFKSNLADNYLAYEKDVDFKGSSSANAIKAWIAYVTGRSNTNLFSGFNINTEVAALMNVLFFSGRLATSFDREGPKNARFTYGDGNSFKDILMMKTQNTFNYSYSQDLNAELVEIPYNGNEVSLFFLLPKTVDGLANLEKQLTLANLNPMIAGLHISKVALTIPFSKAFNEVGTFSYSLFKKADRVSEDLSGIDGQVDLFEAQDGQNYRYSYSTGKNFAEADTSAPDVTFNANHPFLYFFRHQPTCVILFIGRMSRP